MKEWITCAQLSASLQLIYQVRIILSHLSFSHFSPAEGARQVPIASKTKQKYKTIEKGGGNLHFLGKQRIVLNWFRTFRSQLPPTDLCFPPTSFSFPPGSFTFTFTFHVGWIRKENNGRLCMCSSAAGSVIIILVLS